MSNNPDWTGNKATTWAVLGASNHVEHERAENDYYATDPKAIPILLSVEKFSPRVWEPACGEGHLSRELVKAGYEVLSSDKVNRGYGGGA